MYYAQVFESQHQATGAGPHLLTLPALVTGALHELSITNVGPTPGGEAPSFSYAVYTRRGAAPDQLDQNCPHFYATGLTIPAGGQTVGTLQLTTTPVLPEPDPLHYRNLERALKPGDALRLLGTNQANLHTQLFTVVAVDNALQRIYITGDWTGIAAPTITSPSGYLKLQCVSPIDGNPLPVANQYKLLEGTWTVASGIGKYTTPAVYGCSDVPDYVSRRIEGRLYLLLTAPAGMAQTAFHVRTVIRDRNY